MKSKKIIVLLLLTITSAFCVSVDVINMLVTFATTDDRPTSVLLFHLCWTSYEIKALVKSLHDININVASSLQHNRTEYYLQHILFIVDLSCYGIEEHLVQASEEGYFKSPYRWIMLHGQNVFENLDILIDSDVVIANETEDSDFLLIEAYKVSENTEVIYNTRGKWKPRHIPEININNLNTSLEKINAEKDQQNNVLVNNAIISKYGSMEDYRDSKVLLSRRKDLRKHPMTIANVITESNESRQHLNDRLQLDKDLLMKMSYAVATILFDMLNGTEKIVFTHTWGYKDKYGNWDGVVGLLINKQVDVGTLTIFSTERLEVIEYLSMVGSTNARFIFRDPPLAYVSNIFTLPFTTSVWIAVFVCVICCAIFLFITSKCESTRGTDQNQMDGSWADVLIVVIGAVLQQGCTQEPRFASGRCVMLLLYISLTILFAAYSANIVVLLRATSSSIRTVQDLQDSPLELGASDFEYTKFFFKQLNDPLRKSIYEKRIAPKGKKGNYYNMKDGMQRVRQGLFAFHVEKNTGYRLIQETYLESEKCDIVEIDFMNFIDPWLPGQKRAPLKDLFKISLIKIREMGVQACIKHRLQIPRPKCSGEVNAFASVGVADIYPAFMATMYGMLMAPAILVLEIAYKRCTTMRNQRERLSKRRQLFY